MICRVCDAKNLELVIDLGTQPWCNHFLKAEEVGKEPFYPLRVLYCLACQTSQLDYTVPKEIMFGDHTYLSGVTRSLSEHFARVAEKVDADFFANRPGKSVLDIGSNDGTQLKHFQRLGYEVLGVESSKTTARLAQSQGVPTENRFFNLGLVKELGRRFDVINAAGVFFHLEELHSVTSGIREALKPDGVFVVQFLYMKRIMENVAFDQIYHEHLLYYNLRTIQKLLDRHGLELFDARLEDIHGGSIVAYVQHHDYTKSRVKTPALLQMEAEEDRSGTNEIQAYHRLAIAIEKMRLDNITYLEAARAREWRVYGMGAPVKGNTLLNYFGVTSRQIQYLVEKNPLRKGLFAPGSHIPIIMEDEIGDGGRYPLPQSYYVLAWNFKREILKNNQALLDRGVEFFFPVDPDRAQRGQAK